MPDAATIWNAILSLIVLAVVGVVSILRDSLKGLQAEIKDLSTRLHAVQLLVTGDYVKKDDLDRKLERIFDKLDGKADRSQ